MYKGQIKGFPVEVVEKMLERQFEQTGKIGAAVFEQDKCANGLTGGFWWDETIEEKAEPDWWLRVIGFKDFPKFFERYPKQSNQNTMSDLKTLVQKIIALKPEKKEQLEKIFPEELKEPPLNVWREIATGDKWLIGDNRTVSSDANVCLYTDSSGNVFLYLHKGFDWEIREGNKLYAKYKP